MRTKLTVTLAVALIAGLAAQAQEKLKVETFHLENGLKVIMAEDHSAPKIFGAVIVHAGSKNEDPTATGVAHYFEHIMFKGTDRIGTTDWEKEKIYLDSISLMYDQLRLTKDEEGRKAVQKEINRLNIEASKYAIANETDAILQQMGCTGLNAGTSYDYTVYYNTLPSNQLANWMDVYVERFRNPVYRLFQSELEAVYEERNMYANEMTYEFSRNLFKESFGEHPYSRDVIGLDDHLKNPQPSQMKVFYDKYYVASNMTLLLVGDFNTTEALKMASERFNVWPRGEKQPEPQYNLPKFDRQVIKEVKQTPIKAGMIIFPGVKGNDPDELPLTVISQLLSGGNGSMDELVSEGELMAASLMPLSLEDAGTNVLIYIPRIVGQKHAAAEELLWACIDSVKAGHFSDELLESIKMQALRDRKEMFESIGSIAQMLESLELTGSSYAEWERDNKRLQRLTREDIMRVAARYFDREHCTIVRSSMGFPAKSAAVKPDWEHLEAQNKGEKSPFARMIEERPVKEITPQVIDFKKDVSIINLTPNCTLYASTNKRNDIFKLAINYHYGLLDDHHMDVANEYFNQIGAGEMTLHQFEIELKQLGGSLYLEADDDYTTLRISGFEENLDAIMALVMQKLIHPRHDAQQVENLADNMKASKRAAKKDASSWNDALRSYVRYGEHSPYLDHTTLKELKEMDTTALWTILQQMYDHDAYVTFVGNTPPEKVANILISNNLIRANAPTTPLRLRPSRTFGKDLVLYASNKSFVKSDIWFWTESPDFDLKDRAAALMFNEYFGGGMNSVVFQEIREFRSLGYSTYGNFSYDVLKRRPPFLACYLGTQCDKTNEGVEAMLELTRQFPDREEKFQLSQDHLISTRNSNYIGFRSIPSQVRYWREVERLDHDPRADLTKQIRYLSYDDIRAFHAKYIANRPTVISISGNAKKFDLKALGKQGELKEVKYKEMVQF